MTPATGDMPRASRRGDGGAVLVLSSVAMLSLLTITALVVDIGGAYSARRQAQANADHAALAAGYYLAGSGSTSLTPDPAGACAAALHSLQTNYGDLPADAAMDPACSSLPGNLTECQAGLPSQRLRSTGSDPYRVTIDWPVDDADIAVDGFDGEFGGDAAPGAGARDGDRCERMRIRVERDSPFFFANVVGAEPLRVSGSVTVLGAPYGGGRAAPALLMLERERCGALQVSGAGGIAVEEVNQQPGVIHIDSSGYAPPCSTNENASGYTIYATERPSSQGGGPAIIAGNSDSRPGQISTYALQPGVQGRGAARYCDGDCGSGLNVRPSGAPVVSRQPVDARWNSVDRPLISELHARGHELGTFSVDDQGPNFNTHDGDALRAHLENTYGGSWRVLRGDDCTAADAVHQGSDRGGADNWYVNCERYTAGNVVFRNTGTVVFAGKVDVSGSCPQTSGTSQLCDGYLAFPNASEILVRGCITQCSGGGHYAIRSGGLISINSGEQLTGVFDARAELDAGDAPARWPWLDCGAHRAGPGAGGTWPHVTTVASFEGPLRAHNGTLSWCQTMYYAGEDAPTYERRAVTSGGNCSEDAPCPSPETLRSNISVNSGSSQAVSWNAPAQGTGGPTDDSPFEHLALWTEGGGVGEARCELGGQGAVRGGGVFFQPNCQMLYSGQADNDNPINAQFIARSLDISGQGLLRLQPSPERSIRVPVGGEIVLIR